MLGLRVILNQEIESGVYAKKIKSTNRSNNKTVFSHIRFMLHVRHKKEHCTYIRLASDKNVTSKCS